MKVFYKFVSVTLSFATSVALAQKTEVLEPVVITAAQTPTTLSETTSVIDVITAQEITNKGFHTVAEALSYVAGVSITSNGSTGQTASAYVRGASGDHVLVMIDGVRLNDPSTPDGSPTLGTLSVEHIERIEILKGGAGGIWGSRASAGVINIITKGASKGAHAQLSVGYGDMATKKATLNLSHGTNVFKVSLTGAFYKTDGISALSPATSENDGYKNTTLTFKGEYNLQNGSFLDLLASRSNADFDFDITPNDANSTGTSKTDTVSLRLRTKPYGALRYFASLNQIKSTRTYSFNGGSSSLNQATDTSLRLIARYDNTNFGYAQMGMEYRKVDGLSSIFQSESGFTNSAFFVSGLYHLNPATTIEGNLRYDSYNNFNNALSYKIGMRHRHDFLEGFSSAINYYSGNDAPSAFQLANAKPGTTLRPVALKGFDLTFNFADILRLSYFQNTATDTLSNTFAGNTIEYFNTTGTEHYKGVELDTFYPINEFYQIRANYTKLFDIQDTKGNTLLRRPKESATISFEHFGPNKSYFSLDGQYIGTRRDFDFSTSFAGIPVQTGNYTIWNVHYSTQVLKHLRFSAHVKNLFDKTYQSVYGYAMPQRNAYFEFIFSY